MRIAAIVLGRADDPDDVAALLTRLELGVPAGALALTVLPISLSRGELLALWRGGLRTSDQVAARSAVELEAVLGRSAGRLLAALRASLGVAV